MGARRGYSQYLHLQSGTRDESLSNVRNVVQSQSIHNYLSQDNFCPPPLYAGVLDILSLTITRNNIGLLMVLWIILLMTTIGLYLHMLDADSDSVLFTTTPP